MDKEKLAELFARETGFHIDFISFDIEGFAQAVRNAVLEEACAAIKAEDDRASAKDYMLDSDDCIEVVRALKTKEGE